jgi:hypothetical protein
MINDQVEEGGGGWAQIKSKIRQDESLDEK